jgi:hypothetical protein
MRTYDTVLEALNDLRIRGFSEDFHLCAEYLTCNGVEAKLYPDEFHVEEYYRFEGMSDPDESCFVYAIVSREGLKGALVDAYGTYAQSLSPEMIRKLRLSHFEIDNRL